MVKGWKTVAISEELYEAVKEYYEQNKVDLKLRYGIRSLTAFFNCCIRQYLRSKGVI